MSSFEEVTNACGRKNEDIRKHRTENRIQKFWNEKIMERFLKANLFMICCVVAGLLLIVYLGAFSCEVSWILEAHGHLPMSAYILCTQYFVVFVATTILIHGLVTGLPWGLFAWSIIISLLSIPELVFVMIMTTQHWGLKSIHGITELSTYLIRLLINCFALICVIPTGIRWRRETQVLSQLQDLATRLQLQTPPPSAPMTKSDSRRSSKRMLSSTYDNVTYHMHDSHVPPSSLNMYNNNNGIVPSQNEFNASVFALPAQNLPGVLGNPVNGHRAQSLMDLRCTLPGMYNPKYMLQADEKNAKYFNITYEDLKKNMPESKKNTAASVVGSAIDPTYCSIEPNQKINHQKHKNPKLSRNCVSLENLDSIAGIKDDTSAYGHILPEYSEQQQYLLPMLGYVHPQYFNPYFPHGNGVIYPLSGRQMHYPPVRRRSSQLQYYAALASGCGGFNFGNYTNPFPPTNSKLSVGNESDDYRKYRDVAL